MSETHERRLGVFRVISSEGLSGSQGSVYRAVCEGEFPGVAVGETVALKTMSNEENPERQQKLAHRVSELSAIQDKHVVRYRGHFTVAGAFQSQQVIVMEWLDGETLKDRLAREPGGLDADFALKIVDGLLAGLEAAHAVGLVHRDVKPGNVFLCRDGTVKLIDFEVAHRASSSAQSSAGGFAGTFDYMAPEFVDPNFRGTFASDVFSAGVVMHEALTAQVPYSRKTEQGEQADFAFLSRWSQRKEGLCAIRIRSSVKRVLSHAGEVLEKALAENPNERWSDAKAFRAALRQIRYREVRSATDSYRLLRLVGEGGFGCVYKARARGTGRFVAVKQLKRTEFGDRFRREARVMQRLDDPSFVRFVDYFETRDVGAVGAFLVMDFLPGMPGSSLRDAIRGATETALPFKDVMAAFDRYARALSLMHRLRIYHRDIKPSNLYYPSGDPGRAAIMDLGIARDVSGTATAGQVPGTLDYMPPEVVLGGSRGDAGMDIYALGLCLYEAVSGRMGYPRLPTGAMAFSAFYERARSRRPPVFDAPSVQSRPLLAALLREMTALDPRDRLQDAEILRRRLAAAAAEIPGESSGVPVKIHTRSMGNEAPTGATAAGAGHRPLPPTPSPDSSKVPIRSRKGVLIAASVIVLGLACAILWKPTAGWLAAWLDRRHADNVQQIMKNNEELQRAEDERLRKLAQAEAEKVLAAFGSTNVTAVSADAKASEWLLRWRKEKRVAELVTSFEGEFSSARSKRIVRDASAAEKSRQMAAERAQRDLVSALRGQVMETSVGEERVGVWKENWLGAIESGVYSKLEKDLAAALSERKNRDARQAQEKQERERIMALRLAEVAKAVAAAARVEAAYGDEKTSLATADAAYANWKSVWRKVLSAERVAAASERIAAARKQRRGADDGNAVVAECGRYLDNILLVGAEDVQNWRNLIDQAAFALQKAEAVGGISPAQAESVRRRISQCRQWVVGVIDNKTDHTVEFGGRTIGPISSATVVFTNGYPIGASVLCEGCEPLRVLERSFSSAVFRVMPRELELRSCDTHATLPPYPTNVLCLVDGIERQAGELRLRRGPHAVKYWRREETFAGTKDYDPKEFTFETHLATAATVPVPTGDWVESVEFKRKRQQRELVERGQSIVSECRRLLQPLPIEARRARLEKVHALLSDWQTSSALSVLGVGVEKDLRADYQAERGRVRGYVLNSTTHPLTVTTDADSVSVPTNKKVLVTFERRWPNDARVVVPGYEFVMLPREPASFDGATFEVRESKLVPLPVRVELPPVEKGVVCRVDGAVISGTAELRPGEHVAIWSKPDHVAQERKFVVAIASPTRVPAPGKWEPNGAFSGLAAAFREFNKGAVDAAKKLTDDIGSIEDPERRRELEDLKRAIELRKKLEKED